MMMYADTCTSTGRLSLSVLILQEEHCMKVIRGVFIIVVAMFAVYTDILFVDIDGPGCVL